MHPREQQSILIAVALTTLGVAAPADALLLVE